MWLRSQRYIGSLTDKWRFKPVDVWPAFQFLIPNWQSKRASSRTVLTLVSKNLRVIETLGKNNALSSSLIKYFKRNSRFTWNEPEKTMRCPWPSWLYRPFRREPKMLPCHRWKLKVWANSLLVVLRAARVTGIFFHPACGRSPLKRRPACSNFQSFAVYGLAFFDRRIFQ